MKKEYITPMMNLSIMRSAEIYCTDIKSSPDADGVWGDGWDDEQP